MRDPIGMNFVWDEPGREKTWLAHMYEGRHPLAFYGERWGQRFDFPDPKERYAVMFGHVSHCLLLPNGHRLLWYTQSPINGDGGIDRAAYSIGGLPDYAVMTGGSFQKSPIADRNQTRAGSLADACGELATENKELLVENAKLRRALDRKR